MRLLISFTALFASVVLLQLGTGGVAPLDALSGVHLGFTPAQIGLLGSAHFVGFFVGCWWAPRLTGTIGHSRAFAAFTGAGTVGILAHMLIVDPLAWAVMRVASGMCVAGCYTIIEAWLQAKVTNATRGRAMATYRVVDILGSLGAQLFIGVLEPASYVSYNLLAIICCAALFPVTLTRAVPPATAETPRLRPGRAWRLSPLAAAAVLVSGVAGAAFRMLGPVYGIEVGLTADRIALFLAAYVLGGALAQLPVGWLADRFDRRKVLIWLSLAAVLACAATVAMADRGAFWVYLTAALFGLATFPLYSVAAAHAHDQADPMERVELSASLLFIYAAGAIGSPLLTAQLIAFFGPAAMFWLIALAHAWLCAFGLLRMRARPSPGRRTRYQYIPRTSFLVGRLLRRNRDE